MAAFRPANRSRLWPLFLAFVAPLVAATPPPPAPADLHTLLESIRKSSTVPGVAAVVLRGDRIIAQGAAGVRAAGSNRPVTIADRFHLGSDTKAMTATLLAILVQEGTLQWDAKVGDCFGGLTDISTLWERVTLAQLVVHRGGAPANLDEHGLWRRLNQRQGTPSQQRLELVRGILPDPPVNLPGSTYLYANSGYAIAGAMAEVSTGRSWEDLMTDKLFRPLGITTAGFGAPGTAGALDQPVGHDAAGKPIAPGPRADNPPAIGPAGSVHMSLPDWAKFVALHLRGDPANPNAAPRLLSPENFAFLHHPADGRGERYAAGWLVTQRAWAAGAPPHNTGLALTHAGSNTMWFCVTWLAPERDFAVLIACNRGGGDAAKTCDQIAAVLIERFNR